MTISLMRPRPRIRDEVAAVAAETEEIAADACGLIEVEYEELPTVFDPEAALRPGAPQIHARFPGNLVNFAYKFTAGDVDRAFREADVVVEGTYRLNYVTTACIGTMAAMAQWDPRGNLTMWSTTQIPFLYQRDLAEALGISGDRIRVIQPPVGGNFGRGLDLYPIDIITALLARHVQRPVKIVFDREEEFVASPTREPCVFTLRTAARADGRLLARDAQVLIDNGAYVSWGSTTPYVMMTTLAGFYRCRSPVQSIVTRHKPPPGLIARLMESVTRRGAQMAPPSARGRPITGGATPTARAT